MDDREALRKHIFNLDGAPWSGGPSGGELVREILACNRQHAATAALPQAHCGRRSLDSVERRVACLRAHSLSLSCSLLPGEMKGLKEQLLNAQNAVEATKAR